MLAAWSLGSTSTNGPGTGVVVEQNEAPLSGNGSPSSPWTYVPDPAYGFMQGKTVINESTGSSGTSSHASNMAQVFYGNLGMSAGQYIQAPTESRRSTCLMRTSGRMRGRSQATR